MNSEAVPVASAVLLIDPEPDWLALDSLWHAAWGAPVDFPRMELVLARSVVSIWVREAEPRGDLIGFVYVATDGGQHGFLLDPTVDPRWRRRGLGTALVSAAADAARQRGIIWLHVDFEPHLAPFYAACGFRPSTAGVMRLA